MWTHAKSVGLRLCPIKRFFGYSLMGFRRILGLPKVWSWHCTLHDFHHFQRFFQNLKDHMKRLEMLEQISHIGTTPRRYCHVCMYVRACACMQIIYVCICIHIHIYIYIYLFAYISSCMVQEFRLLPILPIGVPCPVTKVSVEADFVHALIAVPWQLQDGSDGAVVLGRKPTDWRRCC